MTSDPPYATSDAERIAALERALAAVTAEHATLTAEKAALTERLRDAALTLERLRAAYLQALEQLQLLRRRLYSAQAERSPDDGAQLAFESMLAQVQKLSAQLDAAEAAAGETVGDPPTHDPKPRGKGGAGGRRDLAEANLPVERVELLDPALEGVAERISFEESSRLGYRRGGPVRIVLARAIYRTETPAPSTPAEAGTAPARSTLVTAPRPPELFRRALLAPSMIAHLLVCKYALGVPFYRLEKTFALQGFALDRGTMCRYAEDAGATLGALVEAARKDAFARAFCLATDATGVRVQPGPLQERGGKRGPCHKGHFFVVLADRDHVFFEYQERHTAAVVCELFKGFTGYIQADAHAVYEALFAGRAPPGAKSDFEKGSPPTEVGCWSHCRRRFWEAAVCKHARGVEGLRRIDAIFAADRALADLPPQRRTLRRAALVRPLVEDFFAWVDAERAGLDARGLVASALGYAQRQAPALRRFLEDGRLRLDNNASERALRPIAAARKAWLFFGSDDHAQAAANLFSLIASCKLHGVDPERYLAEVLRVMPHWPRERYLELTPLRWRATCARLDAAQLAREYGPLTVPPPEEPEDKTTRS